MKILIATDAWHPQINGVVRTFERVCDEAPYFGAEVRVLSPQGWTTLPMPTYPEIRLALCTYKGVEAEIMRDPPDFFHIATEGPIGIRTRQFCLRHDKPFTTSYHTKFPEYVRARVPIPTEMTYRWLANFHNKGHSLMVTNESLRSELAQKGFQNITLWSRGVDSKLFRPFPPEESVLDLPRPISLYVGRVSVEKSLRDFLDLDIPGTKVITGKGPQLAELQRDYPDVVFTGAKVGEDLTRIYASSDVFVFPSRTDTFGIVLLEALACGVPVAAYPVTGPRDVIGDADVGVLDEDLKKAVMQALEIPREKCRAFAEQCSWRRSIGEFINNILVANDRPPVDLDTLTDEPIQAF